MMMAEDRIGSGLVIRPGLAPDPRDQIAGNELYRNLPQAPMPGTRRQGVPIFTFFHFFVECY